MLAPSKITANITRRKVLKEAVHRFAPSGIPITMQLDGKLIFKGRYESDYAARCECMILEFFYCNIYEISWYI
jgi:hypothetical protein